MSDAKLLGLLGRLGVRHAVSSDGRVDEGLACRDEEKEDEVDDDHDDKRVVVTGEVYVPGHRQWNADPCLTVEVPMGCPREEWDRGKEESHNPHTSTRPVSRHLIEAEDAEGEAQHQEAIQGDEADDEGRHLAGQQREEAGRLAGHAVSPGCVLPQVAAQVEAVSHAHNGQVHAHEEVGHTKMRDKHPKARGVLPLVDEDASHEAAQVAHQGQSSKDGQQHAIDIGTEQGLTGRDLIKRCLTSTHGKVVGQRGGAAQLVIVGQHGAQLV